MEHTFFRTWSRRPHPALRPLIDRYWGWEAPCGHAAPLMPLLPGPGGMELMFHQGRAFCEAGSVEWAGPASQLLTVQRAPLSLAATGPVRFISIRVRAGAAEALLGQPVDGLSDRIVDAAEVWPLARAIGPALASASGFSARADLLDRMLLTRLAPERAGSACIRAAAAELERHNAGIAELAQQSGWSLRQFENRFRAATGMPPARFRRLARLRRTVKALLLAPRSEPLTGLLDEAYFDQAQQIRDFRCFIGLTPGALRLQAEGRLHFYHPSWPG